MDVFIGDRPPEMNVLPLAQWRREVAEMYARVRADDNQERAWSRFVARRDELFQTHPKTPLTASQRRGFRGLSYYAYDWHLRMVGRLKYDVEPEIFRVELGEDGLLQFRRAASVHFRLAGKPRRLYLYWILGYGGGIFLPFKDETNGRETFGGGRYLYDSIKGADLGAQYDSLLLDFNYAYNPSCAYQARWECPLPPEENRVAAPVEAGEKLFRPVP